MEVVDELEVESQVGVASEQRRRRVELDEVDGKVSEARHSPGFEPIDVLKEAGCSGHEADLLTAGRQRKVEADVKLNKEWGVLAQQISLDLLIQLNELAGN